MSAEKLTVMAWNVQDAIGDNIRGAGVLREIEARDPDVVTLSEAHRTAEGPANRVLEQLVYRGYNVTEVPYHDTDGRADQHNMVALVKPEVLADDPRVIQLAGRNMIRFSLNTSAGPIEWAGIHLFDRFARRPDEDRRIFQVNALARQLADCPAAGIAGDFNAMDTSRLSRFLRAVRPLTYLLPTSEPGEDNDSGIRRIGSLAERLCSMASGDTLRTLRSYDYENIDPAKQPTVPSARPRVDLDHIMTRGLIATDFRVHDHLVYESVPVSDHRAISAVVQVAKTS
jgi:endonuclease/exonuclease/phosphatase family metal-dependent hydrolase